MVHVEALGVAVGLGLLALLVAIVFELRRGRKVGEEIRDAILASHAEDAEQRDEIVLRAAQAFREVITSAGIGEPMGVAEEADAEIAGETTDDGERGSSPPSSRRH